MEIKGQKLEGLFKKYILKNKRGFEVHVLNYGAIIQKVIFMGQNMVLTYSDPNLYINNSSYMGAVVGPTAGRIADHSYVIDGQKIEIEDNENGNNLHGGKLRGISNKYFEGEIFSDRLELTLEEFGIKYTVIYRLSEDKDELIVENRAKSDKKTYINMTNHTYFNLEGSKKDILEETLQINANEYVKVNSKMVPTSLENVEGTVFDFRKPKKIGSELNALEPQFDISYYIDHPFKLNKEKECDIILRSSDDKIKMTLKTNQNYVVVYAGNFLEPKHLGIALEAQNCPNGINLGEEFYELTDKDNSYEEIISYTFEGSI